MELLYVHEHTSCKHYISDFQSGFTLRTLAKNEILHLNQKKDFAVIFLEKGSIFLTDHATESKTIYSHHICLLTNYISYDCIAIEDSVFTMLIFDKPAILCDKYSLMALSRYTLPSTDKIRVLPIKKPIESFLDGMKLYLSNKMYCSHLHDIKESEWLFLMRGFYLKEESAYFFHPVMKSFSELYVLVKENYLHVKSVQELAGICNMNLKTFTRRFKEEFNDSPKHWILIEKSKHIEIELTKNELNLSEISEKYGFNSTSHFHHYLKNFSSRRSMVRY